MSGLTRTDFRLAKSRAIYRLLRQEMRQLTYTQVAEKVGTSNRSLGGPFGIIQEMCDANGLPTITVWVISKWSGISKHRLQCPDPGRGGSRRGEGQSDTVAARSLVVRSRVFSMPLGIEGFHPVCMSVSILRK